MFDDLTRKLEDVFKKLRGQGRLTPENIRDSMRQIRRALLEADVHLQVAKDFVGQVESRATGQDVMRSLTPGQQVVGIVYDEMVKLLGGAPVGLAGSPHLPTVVLLIGLQGSGKTTFAGKLAAWLASRGKRTLLTTTDLRRPAAAEQLATLASQCGAGFWRSADEEPAEIGRQAVDEARRRGFDFLILDTAGRWHVDEELMVELEGLRASSRPHQILLVVDGMTGQEAVRIGTEFTRRIGLDGVVLTKMDGDARGGAALSLRQVTGRPILFLGVGEKLDGLEPMDPSRLASRILGMGDVLTLVEKAQQTADQERLQVLAERQRRGEFTLEDFLDQLRQVRKMGSFEELLRLVPGVPRQALAEAAPNEQTLKHYEAILLSMTPRERRQPRVIDGSRRRRIAAGSGTSVPQVNRLLRDFDQARTLMKRLRHGPRHFPVGRGASR